LTFLKKIKGVQEEIPKRLASKLSAINEQKNSNYKRELEFTLQD